MANGTINTIIKKLSTTATVNADGASGPFLTPKDIIVAVNCTNSVNVMCLPWQYGNNGNWYIKFLNWQDMSKITSGSLNIDIFYI